MVFSMTSGLVFKMPMQLGPISRIPDARHTETSSFWRFRPSSPTSANPEEMTTMARTCFLAHSLAASTTDAAGTTITARSTGPGMSPTDR